MVAVVVVTLNNAVHLSQRMLSTTFLSHFQTHNGTSGGAAAAVAVAMTLVLTATSSTHNVLCSVAHSRRLIIIIIIIIAAAAVLLT